MKHFTVVCEETKETKQVTALHARSACNKAFRPGYSYRWFEVSANDNPSWSHVHLTVSTPGKAPERFYLYELG